MNYVEAPTEYRNNGRPSVFLAGGITGCGDWQQDLADRLRDTGLVVLNPRRKCFPIDDPSAAEAQIRWEFRHLRRATARVFWFPSATHCPIALYELGASSMTKGPLFVGTDPRYARRADVEIQTKLARPDVEVVYSIEALATQVLQWHEQSRKKQRPKRPQRHRGTEAGQTVRAALPRRAVQDQRMKTELQEASAAVTCPNHEAASVPPCLRGAF
jgi:Nucleoside 2-deoxyribosyltransferase like